MATDRKRKPSSNLGKGSRPRARREPAVITRARRNINWVEKYCRVPEGKDVGKAVVLRPWQRELLTKIYDNPHGTRRAIISFGRKNGKSSLSAFILLLHLCGPEATPNSQLYSAAQSRDQAALVFGLAAKMIRMSVDLNAVVAIRDTAKQLHCVELGTTYRALSADASTAMGLSPVLCLHDELGQVRGGRSAIYDALETATGAQQEPLSIIISTQAPSDSDLLSVLIDDAKAGHDPRVLLSLYTAPAELDPFSDAAIKLANPAYGDFLNAKEVRAMAEDARRMSSRESEFRNLVLNQRCEASSRFIDETTWQTCGDDVEPIEGMPVFGGLDLSSVDDLTALVLIGKVGGKWQVHPTFWVPSEGLHERARHDRVPYDLWVTNGNLLAAPGKSVDYEYVAEHLRTLFDQYQIERIGFDPWRFAELKKWLLHVGFTEEKIVRHFVEFRQGFQSMAPALRKLGNELLNKRIAHGNHPVLAMCARNAVVVRDPANNEKLAKNKSVGRIDGMVALTMALGVADMDDAPPVEHKIFVI